MCKVSLYLKNNNFILTSSRDISIERAHSLPPKISILNNVKVLSPIDPQGKGSWIGISSSYAASILNHSGKDINSDRSRGGLLMKILSNQIQLSDVKNISKGYMPFRLLVVDIHSYNLYEYIWDGKECTSSQITKNKNIFLSRTIYSKEESEFYTNKFMSIDDSLISSDQIYSFHLNKENIHLGDKNITTSVTQISNIDNLSIKYSDLLDDNEYSSHL